MMKINNGFILIFYQHIQIFFKNIKIFLIEFKANQSATTAINQIKQKYLISYQNSTKQIYLCGINFDLENREVGEVKVI